MCSDARQCVTRLSLGLSTRTTYPFCSLFFLLPLLHSLLMLAPPLPLCASHRDADEISLPPFHPFSYRAVPRDLRTTRVRVGDDGGGFRRAKRLPPPYSSPSRCSATSMDAGDTPRGRWGPSLDLSLLLFLLLPLDRTLLYLLLLLLLTSSGLDLMDAVVVRVPVSHQGQISSLLE